MNVDFAPVADVVGTSGGVIGSRSYGADADRVAAQVAASVRGLQGAGVAATLKHFPGHGHTSADSHTELPVLEQTRKRLDDVDLRPFAAGIDAGAWLVMSGHLDVQAVDPGVSATFSHKVLTDVLRGDLGFQGVVVSDAMNMAPAMKWPAGEAAVRALEAGNDLLLMPPNVGAAYDGILAAVRGGDLPRDRLVEAATRVLTLRFRLAGTPLPPLSRAQLRRPPPGRRRPRRVRRHAAARPVRGGGTGPGHRHRLRWSGDLARAARTGAQEPRRAHPAERRHRRAPRRVRRRRGGPERRRRGHRRHGHPVPARPVALRHPPGDVLLVARFADRARPRHRRQGAPHRPVTRTRARFAPYGVLMRTGRSHERLIRFAERHEQEVTGNGAA